MVKSEIDAFVALARQYCSWAEGSAQTSTNDLTAALSLLPRLYVSALELPDVFSGEDTPQVLDVEWQHIYQRFGALPFNYYSCCLEPHKFPHSEMGICDVADDLADIWRDLKRGLMLFDAGAIHAATWEWRFHFHRHWGEHATGALHALHCWRTEVE